MPDLAELLRDAFTRLYGDQAAAGGLLGQAQAPAPAGGGVLGQAVRQPQPQPFADIDQAIAAAAPTPTRPAGAPEPPLGPEPYGFPPGQGMQDAVAGGKMARPSYVIEPRLAEQQLGLEHWAPPGAMVSDSGELSYPQSMGGATIPVLPRPPLWPRMDTPEGRQWVMPGLLDLAGYIMGGPVPRATGEMVAGSGMIRGRPGVPAIAEGAAETAPMAGPAANAPGMLPEALKQSIEAQRPRTFADYVIQRTQGMAPADVLQSDALWAKAQDMATATGRPFNQAFAELAGVAGAPMTPQAAQTYINAQRAQLSGIRAVPEGGTVLGAGSTGERGTAAQAAALAAGAENRASVGGVLGGAPAPVPPGPGPLQESLAQALQRQAEKRQAGLLPEAVYAPRTAEAAAAAEPVPLAVLGGNRPPEPITDRVSPRMPTGVRATEDPLAAERLQIDTAAMKAQPNVWSNVDLTHQYPGFTPSDPANRDTTAREFIDHVKSNLLYLYDSVPDDIRERSKQWYVGGRAIADQMAQTYGIDPKSAAAAIANLSPQKDWFENVDLANRVMHISQNVRNVPLTPEMTRTADRIYQDPAISEKSRARNARLLTAVEGKTYGELTDPLEKAFWLRLYDEAHHTRSYNVMTPEGGFSHVARNDNGEPTKISWGSLGEISKAIQSIEANGDLTKISPLLGDRHKVRSFYNNIIDPHANKGDVTIDTHAVAAGLLRPLSGDALEVVHNFANYPGKNLPTAKGSSISGAQGTYGLYADAYREAARDRKVLPREMQSITWEAARGLFTDTYKSNASNLQAITDLWNRYQDGLATLDETRRAIIQHAGGINAPEWHGR